MREFQERYPQAWSVWSEDIGTVVHLDRDQGL
jgi:hypothetical protein